MGCWYSTEKAYTNHNTRTTIHPEVELTEPRPPPPTDPRLPLNAREVFKLKNNWKAIKRNMESTGIEMFVRLFRQNVELKNLFADFKDVEDIEQLRQHEAVERHAGLVMSMVDDIISNIDDVDYVLQVCDQLNGTHSQFRGFSIAYFWEVEEPFLDALKTTLGDRYSDQMEHIYRTTLKFMLQTLTKSGEGSGST